MDPRCLPLLLVLLPAFVSAAAASDEIHGCGGFVEASSGLAKSRRASDSKLDYSHITVELCTLEGLVKESTQCAPNGYYFIPVYDKGSFMVRVKGLKGWSWKPETVPVIIDQNGCHGNADINFQFTGFMISGKVLGAVGGKSCLKDGGPSGVKVELMSDSNELVASALTSSTGEYTFANIIPGRYKLRASHPDYDIKMRGSPEVDLRFGNAVADDVFFVSGYNIYGSVVAQGNPMFGVHLYLYSNDVTEVPCPQGSGEAPKEGALCHAISGADGKFMFKSLPCGNYELVPYYKGENTVFDVSPSSLPVSVEHSHMTIPQKFQVTGFSVGGRVVDGYGSGVEGANVIVDGQLRAVTDTLGHYRLDQMATTKRTARKSTTGRHAGRLVRRRTEEETQQAEHEVEPQELEESQDAPQEEEPQEVEQEEPEEEPQEVEQEEPKEESQEVEQENDEDPVFHRADTFRSSGVEGGQTVGHLRAFLRSLGIGTAPMYLVKRVPRPGREEWQAMVHIFDVDSLLSSHHAPASRATRREALDDAAWEALTSLCHTHRRGLDATSFALYPLRQSGTRRYTSTLAGGYLPDGAKTRTADLVLDLSSRLQAAQDEIKTLRTRLEDTEETLRAHMKMRAGEQSDLYSSEIRTWTATSPARRPRLVIPPPARVPSPPPPVLDDAASNV